MILESKFKRNVIKKIATLFPGSVILKNDANYFLGIPDTLVLFEDRWAMLEFKREKDARRQPNQEYYIKKFNGMSYASFLQPENEEQVLNELQQALKPVRLARFSRC